MPNEKSPNTACADTDAAQVPDGNAAETIPAETVACDLCQSRDHETLYVGRDRLHHTPGVWPVVRCRQCGLVFTNPRPMLSALDKIYPADYSPHKSTHRRKRRWRWRLQNWSLRHHWNYPPASDSLLGKLISLPAFAWTRWRIRNYDIFPYEGEGKLLDYGCGNGKYLRNMQDRGWRVTGMDASAQAVAACGEQGIEARQGIDMAAAFPPASFNVVTLWHVLEHVPSPTATIRQAQAILKPRGKLVIGVPNINSLPAQWFGERWFALELPRHLTHFSPVTLRELLRRNGFTVEKVRPQLYGQTLQSSFRYLADDTGKKGYAWLARSKRLCYLLQLPSFLVNRPALIIVHARKV